jgi:RNA-directed DNA polymerase
LTRYLKGWRAYFGFCQTPSVLRKLDPWIRRRLRCLVWVQWKRGPTRYRALRQRGVGQVLAANTPTGQARGLKAHGSCRGPWRLSNSSAMTIAFPNAAFAALGLPSLEPTRHA